MSIEDIPTALADMYGITEATAQVLLSIFVMFAILLPALYLSKGNKMVSLIALFFGESLCVGLTWLPFWMLIMTVAVVALGVAAIGRDGIIGN